MTEGSFPYLKERVDDQISYFERSATYNQRNYRLLKRVSVFCNILTTVTIALAFTVPAEYKVSLGIGALILSALVLFTYQWEELENYGAKWEKFRLIAEQLKSEKHLFLNNVGRYSTDDQEARRKSLITVVENLIKGTDTAYFSLMVEPGKRIEKRLSTPVEDLIDSLAPDQKENRL